MDNKHKNLSIPTIHLNGTGKEKLIKQYENVAYALSVLLDQMYEAYPHGRDYYPQGESAFEKARKEHQSRVDKILGIQEEINYIWNTLLDIEE